MKKVLLTSLIFCFLKANSVVGDPLANLFDMPATCSQILSLTPKDCKITRPIKYETRKHFFSGTDFNWKCDGIGNLQFDFFNSSTQIVRKIAIEGATFGTRLSERVFVPPGNSKYVYAFSSGAFCRKEKSARLYFEHQVKVGGGECLQRYSSAEIQRAQNQCRTEAVRRKDEETIYNNCVVSKSKGVDRSAIREVRFACQNISKNPSFLEKLRWGK